MANNRWLYVFEKDDGQAIVILYKGAVTVCKMTYGNAEIVLSRLTCLPGCTIMKCQTDGLFICRIHLFVRSSGQIFLPRYLVNSLSSLDETYREYLIVPTDDLIRFWKSKVKVTADRRFGKGINFDAKSLKSVFLRFLMCFCP